MDYAAACCHALRCPALWIIYLSAVLEACDLPQWFHVFRLHVAFSLPRFPHDNWSSTASSGKANDWRTRERVVLDLLSKLEMCKIQGFLSVNLSGHVMDNPMWANFGEQNCPFKMIKKCQNHMFYTMKNVSVCRFKTSLCVPAPRPHVVTHVRVVPAHTGTF